MSDRSPPARANDTLVRKPFRAVDVLSGSIDRREPPPTERHRKQISAQLEPAQLRLLGELHARLNATARKRIEKSDLVGLGIELLAAALDAADGELAPEPDGRSRQAAGGRRQDADEAVAFRDANELRAYVRRYVRRYVE